MNLPGRISQASSAALIVWLALPGTGCGPAPNIEEAGGYRVTYALRAAKPADPPSSVAARQEMAIAALQQRLEAFDLPGSKAEKSGTDQIQITLPGVTPAAFAEVQKLLATPGKLEFRILAQKGTHDAIIDAAIAALKPPDSSPQDDPSKSDLTKSDPTKSDPPQDDPPQEDPPQDDPPQVDPPKSDPPKSDQAPVRATPESRWVGFDPSSLELSPGNVQRTVGGRTEVLIVLDDINVEGRLLESVNGTVDSLAQPAVAGRFKPEGTRRMKALTAENLPRGNVFQRLGVVLDDRLLVAPNIQEAIVAGAFMLTGKFTKQEIDFLVAVLRAGQLPVELDPKPIKIEQLTGTQE